MELRLGALTFDLPEPVSDGIAKGLRSFPAGSHIFHEGDRFGRIIVVIDGWVSATKSFESGDTQLIDFALPGDILDPAIADGVTAGLAGHAITDVTLCMISSADWDTLLQANAGIRTAVDHIKAAERARISERILRLGKGNAKTRIAYALLEFCVRLDALEEVEDRAFHIPLTQSDIGEFTGLSTVHVCRMMGEFVKDGVIETDDHLDIHITDLRALSEVAGINPEQLSFEIKPELTSPEFI